MKEFKGTKGQWKFFQCSENRICFENPIGIDLWSRIEDYNRITTTKEENEANAQLIAAAPELLEALQDLVNVLSDKHYVVDDFTCLSAKSAINKALGQ